MSTNIEKTNSAEINAQCEDDPVLTKSEVAERCKVSEATVGIWIESGQLPAFDASSSGKAYRQWRIRSDDLRAFLLSRGNQAYGRYRGSERETQSVQPPSERYV